MSGIISPATQLISNLIYVGISVLGGYRVATGSMTLGDVQAFIQYSRQFGMPPRSNCWSDEYCPVRCCICRTTL